jgi:hypothetical protein
MALCSDDSGGIIFNRDRRQAQSGLGFGGEEQLMAHTIYFPDDFLTNIEIWGSKGFANIEVGNDGARYRLSFVDPANVRMGLESSDPETINCFAEPGIRSAVDQLVAKRFFVTLVPMGRDT